MSKPDMTSAEFRNSPLARQMRSGTPDYKAELESQMRAEGLPDYEREFVFNEKRKWRFDYLFPVERVAVEYEGGIFDKGKGGHSSITGIMRDIEKYNEATLAGYTVIRVTAQSVASGAAIRYIFRALDKARCVKIASDGRAVDEVKRTLKGLLKKLEAA